jgi:hypothetical protein
MLPQYTHLEHEPEVRILLSQFIYARRWSKQWRLQPASSESTVAEDRLTMHATSLLGIGTCERCPAPFA